MYILETKKKKKNILFNLTFPSVFFIVYFFIKRKKIQLIKYNSLFLNNLYFHEITELIS